MFINDLNLLLLVFHLLLLVFLTSLTNSLGLLIIAELIWITLYLFSALNGILNDDLTLMALPFFFLIFSAVELGFGLLLLTLQLQITRSLDVNSGATNHYFENSLHEPFHVFKQ